MERCVADGDLFLSVVDLALTLLGGDATNKGAIDHLDAVLRVGRSALMVSPDRCRLVARVVPEAAAAAREVIDSGERAGKYLAEAWRHTYGRDPHPGTAYREAVRAIEAAVCPVIIPKDPKATLGRAIQALKQAKPGTFATVFVDTVPEVSPLDAVRGLMELVWTNELDRHGTDDESVPLHVSSEQAHAALHAAVTLVQWFLRGVVKRAAP